MSGSQVRDESLEIGTFHDLDQDQGCLELVESVLVEVFEKALDVRQEHLRKGLGFSGR